MGGGWGGGREGGSFIITEIRACLYYELCTFQDVPYSGVPLYNVLNILYICKYCIGQWEHACPQNKMQHLVVAVNLLFVCLYLHSCIPFLMILSHLKFIKKAS